jgi:uncharacterized cupredoxin-like copper-binding protein
MLGRVRTLRVGWLVLALALQGALAAPMQRDREVGLELPLFDGGDRDFRFLLGSCDIEPGSATPKVMRMLDFNLWAWNSRGFPGIDSLNLRLNDKVRIRIGNLTMTNYPIHLQGHEFVIAGTDGVPEMIGMDHKENDLKTLAPRTPARRAAIKGLAVTAAIATMPVLHPPARAHTGQPHAREPGPVRKEQKDWGIAGEAKTARRTIEVGMADSMRFSPDRIDVRLGETVRFVVRNRGRVLHEFVIGTPAENARHAELMLKFPDMEHDEPYMAHVAPGKTGQIVWTFNRAGEFEFACLIAGHYQAGMVGSIRVAAAR